MSETKRVRSPAALPDVVIRAAVEAALVEDLGLAGDITTQATIPEDASATATFGVRSQGCISGLDVARTTFELVDTRVQFEPLVTDGEMVNAGQKLARVQGPARSVLSGERVALNFLGRMSGIASLTSAYVNRVAHTRAQIVDTRKTTPGLRAFEKYAVRCGGGMNHRVGLFDAVLIKDNHIAVAGGVAAALEAARTHAGHMVKIEIEVDTLAQLEQVLNHDVDAVLLDNMTPGTLAEAVAMIDGRCLAEASGGVSLETVAAIADSGVDLISIGALTHSATVLDIGLDIAID
ncbi:MAG: carboxylating nicotinate-nucleotide diphosphorylase [Pseudomonadota bacterium]